MIFNAYESTHSAQQLLLLTLRANVNYSGSIVNLDQNPKYLFANISVTTEPICMIFNAYESSHSAQQLLKAMLRAIFNCRPFIKIPRFTGNLIVFLRFFLLHYY